MEMRSNNEWPKYHNEDEQEGGDSAKTKPNIGRRSSRASKKTPTTLLNANANNFRSLVQQFTGCPSSSDPNLLYLSNRKGPLNLNFCLNNATPIVESPPILSPVYPLIISHPQQQQQPSHNNHNIIGQDQQRYSRMFSSSSSSSSSLDGICMTNYTTQNHAFNNNNNGTMEMISDSFVMDDNYALSILDYAPSTEY